MARPNIVVVLADDLDVPTTAMLPRLPDLVANKGISFTRAYATQPLCAPSRASILTGQYTHNHGVNGNEPPSNGFVLFRQHEGATLATWLKSAGYRTALVGKYMNAYAWGAGEGYIPPGWDEWYGHLSALEDGRYWNYWVNDNRDVYRRGNKAEDYSVDVEAQRAVQFIRDSASRPEPIFLYAAPEAPHVPSNYAERFGGQFRYSFAPRPPSFNESDVRNKPSWIRQLEYMTDAQIDDLDEFERWRLRSMGAVEDEIAGILQALAETGRLENTYFFFLSDNGILLGQHRAVGRKNNVYEETIGIPFMVRGPGVAPRKVDDIVLNIDLAPTLLELAGVPIPETVDGASLVPFLRGTTPPKWRTDFIAEAYALGPTLAHPHARHALHPQRHRGVRAVRHDEGPLADEEPVQARRAGGDRHVGEAHPDALDLPRGGLPGPAVGAGADRTARGSGRARVTRAACRPQARMHSG